MTRATNLTIEVMHRPFGKALPPVDLLPAATFVFLGRVALYAPEHAQRLYTVPAALLLRTKYTRLATIRLTNPHSALRT